MATRVQTLPVPVSTTCVHARRQAQREDCLLCHCIISLLTKLDLCPGYTRANSFHACLDDVRVRQEPKLRTPIEPRADPCVEL